MRLCLFGVIPLELHILKTTKDYDSLVNKSVCKSVLMRAFRLGFGITRQALKAHFIHKHNGALAIV